MKQNSGPTRQIASYYPDMISDTCSIHDAIVYRHLEFWSQHATKEHEGHKWFYKTAREIAQDTGLSEQQVTKSTAKLANSGLLTRIHNPERGYDRTYWYRADLGSTGQSTKENNAMFSTEQCKVPYGTMEGSDQNNAMFSTEPSKVPNGTSNTSRDTLDNNRRDTLETTAVGNQPSTRFQKFKERLEEEQSSESC